MAVSDLIPGNSVEGVYLLSAKETRQTRQGKPFFKMRVSDRTGTIDCSVWEVDSVEPGVKVGDLVTVCARVTEYQGRPQLEATRVTTAPVGAASPQDFLPSTYRDVEELKGFLRFHVGSVYDRDFSALLQLIFEDEVFLEVFSTAPAAKLYHHAYLGGLLEHTVAVAEMCEFVGQQYGRIDRDLLLTAALLHDIGKTRELAFESTIDFTDAGKFLSRYPGVMLVSENAGNCGIPRNQVPAVAPLHRESSR
jgi:3'-5' exoribonuclease